MHISIERLHEFVMGLLDLTGAEQTHLVRCSLCVQWLDACAEEKVSLLIESYRRDFYVFFRQHRIWEESRR
jgi:hypothetical protein